MEGILPYVEVIHPWGDYQDFSIENPTVPISAADELLTDGARETASGIRLNRETALTHPAVWQAIDMISGDVAKLPLHTYRRFPDGNTERATDHPVYRLLRRRPNSEMDAFKFWRRFMVHALLWRNAYAYVIRDGRGSPLEIVPLLPDRTKPKRDNGSLYYETEIGADRQKSTKVRLEAENVIHVEGLTINNLAGYDVLEAARNAWALGLAGMGFASRFFRSGGRTGGLLELPANAPKPVKDKVEEGFRRTYESPDAAFKTVILREGSKFHAAQMSPEQTQMIERSRESVRDVARFFNLHPSRLGEENRSSYNSKSEDNRDYLDTTLSHWLIAITHQCEAKLLTEAEVDPPRNRPSVYIEHNTDALLRMNTLERYQAYQIGIQSTFLNVNEVRRKENMNSVPGGDEFINPNTTSGGTASTADEASQQAYRRLVGRELATLMRSIWARAARHAKKPMDFQQWVEHDRSDRRASLSEAILPIAQTFAAVFGGIADRLAAGIVDAADGRLQSDLTWLLDKPAAFLKDEVERLAGEYTEDTCGQFAEAMLCAK